MFLSAACFHVFKLYSCFCRLLASIFCRLLASKCVEKIVELYSCFCQLLASIFLSKSDVLFS
ncbi:hypothetical protein HanXRQr2_Chr15g0708601 [Helianthus annuus]|uniref:Uncharacterized protein n=1 Tax=Helianthus annuus TaxID=4232 RepID=A0A9K3E4E1_HELAN|nr:hypothetical protein HanXRQr2_Chr15g0708601 [Helianthus annuus]KAJ0832564.1 hypothetical protein HanPSC8_Chr15g0680171 [Helianthus annuus]